MTDKSLQIFAVLGSAAALALWSGDLRAQASFLTDLGAVAPGLGINNNGQVALQNYFYSGGTLTAFPAGFTGAGINASGQVVGSTLSQTVSPGCPPPYPAQYGGGGCFGVWAAGTLSLYPVYGGFPDSSLTNFALGINASGQIVGGWQVLDDEYQGAIELSNGAFSPLAFPSGSTCANPWPADVLLYNYAVASAINDAGQIVGSLPISNPAAGIQCGEAFLLSQGVYTDIGGGNAYALNASGQVVGGLLFAPIPATGQLPPFHAFLYDSASAAPAAQDLGTLPGGTTSLALAINSQGLVVGASCSTFCGYSYAAAINSLSLYVGGGGSATAFFYNGVMIDLNTFILASDPLHPYVTLTDARGINDNGLVIVNGVDSRTQAQHAYLLQAPLIQIAPGPLFFPSEPIGSVSAPQTLTFTNVGTTPLALGPVAVAGSFTIQSNNCGASLGAATPCMIAVAYAPAANGSAFGTLTLPAGGVPIVVPLGIALTASISSSASTTTAGTPVELTWSASPGASCSATGGSAADGWINAIAASGTRAVAEATPGTYTYGISCTAGPQTQSAQAAPVEVSWPAVTAVLTASPTTLYTGQSTMLTWSSENATTCASSGGGSNDSWPNGTRPTSGSVMITEPNPVISGGSETLTFTITCTSSASSLSGASSVKVVQLDQPQPSSGGGGALDLLAVVFLCGVLAAPRAARRWSRTKASLSARFTAESPSDSHRSSSRLRPVPSSME